MCGGKAPKDNSAEIARQQEADRVSKVNQGKTAIDEAFDGRTSGANAATAYQPGGVYYTANGQQWAPSQADYNESYLNQFGLTPEQRAAYDQQEPIGQGDSYLMSILNGPTAKKASEQFGALTNINQATRGQSESKQVALPSRDFQGWAASQANDLIGKGQLFTGTAHSGGFNDDYYGGLTKDYENYYNPQLQEQFDDALKQLTFQVARSGNSESTAANELFAKAEKQRKDASTQITNDALAATGKRKADVASQRSNLYSLNSAAADPTSAASQAAQSALALQQPVSYNPLGQVFASLIQTGGNAAAVNNATSAPGYGGVGPSAPSSNNSYSKSGSGYKVG